MSAAIAITQAQEETPDRRKLLNTKTNQTHVFGRVQTSSFKFTSLEQGLPQSFGLRLCETFGLLELIVDGLSNVFMPTTHVPADGHHELFLAPTFTWTYD